jgi:hypothetical protein
MKAWLSRDKLGTTLRNQNVIQKENESRLNSVNACYHSARNRLSSVRNIQINAENAHNKD